MAYLLSFLSSHDESSLFFKCFVNFNNLYLLHIRENEIRSEMVILPMVALIFSPTIHLNNNTKIANYDTAVCVQWP